MRRVAAGACLLWGCAVSDGDWLTTIIPGTLSARLSIPSERRTTDGWLKTDQGYELLFDALAIQAPTLTLWGIAGGDMAAAVPLLSMPAGGEVPVAFKGTSQAGVALGPCWPRCGLEAGTLTSAQVLFSHLRATGAARGGGGRLPQETPFAIDVALAQPFGGPGLSVAEDLAILLDRGGPARALASVTVEVTPGMLDGIDWSALGRVAGALCLDDSTSGCQSAPALARLREDLELSGVTLDLSDAY